MLSSSIVEHTHRGMALSTWVDGSRAIFRAGVIDINPEDARKIRVTDGDEVTVNGDDFKLTWPVRLEKEQPRGTLFVVLPHGESINANPQPVRLRKKNV